MCHIFKLFKIVCKDCVKVVCVFGLFIYFIYLYILWSKLTYKKVYKSKYVMLNHKEYRQPNVDYQESLLKLAKYAIFCLFVLLYVFLFCLFVCWRLVHAKNCKKHSTNFIISRASCLLFVKVYFFKQLYDCYCTFESRSNWRFKTIDFQAHTYCIRIRWDLRMHFNLLAVNYCKSGNSCAISISVLFMINLFWKQKTKHEYTMCASMEQKT